MYWYERDSWLTSSTFAFIDLQRNSAYDWTHTSELSEIIQMRIATTSGYRSRTKGLGVFLWMVVVLALLATPTARANTYMFSFTGQQALNALLATEGATIFNKSGYFALFVQPDPSIVTSYTWVSQTSPNVGAADAWDATTITDPSSPNLGYGAGPATCTANCTWAQFSKGNGQTSVALLSLANGGPGGANIFLNHQFWDNVPAPYGWGPTHATITSIMATSALFQFVIDTPLTLPGNVPLLGFASELRSAQPNSFPFIGSKEFNGIPFSLTASVGSSVPEPGTWVLFGSAAALLAGARKIPKKKKTS
jgi:hypothetical protein